MNSFHNRTRIFNRLSLFEREISSLMDTRWKQNVTERWTCFFMKINWVIIGKWWCRRLIISLFWQNTNVFQTIHNFLFRSTEKVQQQISPTIHTKCMATKASYSFVSIIILIKIFGSEVNVVTTQFDSSTLLFIAYHIIHK